MKKRYKILSIILALVIALGSIITISIVSSSAAKFTDENGIEWSVTENYPGWAIYPTNKSSISGEITIPATYNNKVITAISQNAFRDCKNITSVVIPNGVGFIGSSAFYGCSELTSIELCNTLQYIDSSAFSNCISLTAIDIPDSVNTISGNAFYGCTSLTHLQLGNGIKSFGDACFGKCTGLSSLEIPNGITNIKGFSGCTSLSSITIPDSVTEICDNAFYGCTGLTSINIPDSVTTIGQSAFKGCTGLTSINIPDSVTEICDTAFYGCTGLTSAILGNGITTIGYNAFYDCKGLTSVTFGSNIKSIGNNAFRQCSGLTSIALPNSVVEIGSSAFMSCKGLSGELVIPSSISKISNNAFDGCINLTSVTIPNGVKEIESNAFDGCTSLTGELIIPNSVTSVGKMAFYGCNNLTDITIPVNLTNIGEYAFPTKFNSLNPKSEYFKDEYGNGWYATIYSDGWAIEYNVPEALSGDITIPNSYKNKPIRALGDKALSGGKNITSVTIPNSIVEIGNSAFSGCTSLTSINIPDSVTKIGASAFYDCTSLTGALIIPDSVTEIGTGAFTDCTGLTSINIPDSITEICDNAFYECTGLTGELVIPDSVTKIGTSAFNGCSGLTSVTLGSSITTIGDNAFSGCSGLTGALIIPDSVTEIRNRAFVGCTGLTSVTFGSNLTTIGNDAFSGCSGLTGNLVIPDSVTYIGDFTFYDCVGLQSVALSKNLTTLGKRAFNSCINLSGDLVIPNGLKRIEECTFTGCFNLNSISIPDSVTYIGDSAFRSCSNAFDSITIGKNIEYVGKYAFADLGELDTLTVENKQLSDISIIAFYNDTFKNLIVADTVEEINTPLLSGNKNFASVGLGSNITNITDNAFYGNTNMTIQTTTNANSVIDYANKNNIPYEFVNLADVDKKVTFEVTCDKPGYEFTVYRVADLEKGSNPYYIRYDSLITDIEDEIFEGDSTALLEELDKVDTNSLTEVIGTYSTDVDGSSKLFEDLPAGIYYVRATNFPANVYSVQNSVFALPYYTEENGWIYEITPIPLATKVDESNPEIVKTITNSTKDNVNFTDVSLGDTVNFEIEASRVGSANVVESKDFRLNSYVVSDIMENGLTLNQDSFVVTLEDADGNTLTTLEDTTDYVVNVVASEGVDTTFTVSLTPEYLQEDEFYSSANVVIAYSAVLNKYSTREFDGNYNTATNLTYSNKTNVSATVEGNTVYAYTFGIEVNKYDDAGTPLAGSQFGLYLTEDDAKAMANAIATGTSTDTGKVEFFTESNDVIRLASGTYYIVETKATESYNRYTDVIPVTITVNYGDTEVNGTYIESAPENGIQLVEVKNSKVVIPNTGGEGAMYRYIIALAFAMLAVTLIVLKKRSSKKATAIE